MEETLTKLATQIPALATLVALVVVFVRYLERRDLALKEISDNCHTTQQNSTKAVLELTEVLGEVRGILVESDIVRRIR